MGSSTYTFSIDLDADDIDEEAHREVRNAIDDHFGRGTYDRVMSGNRRDGDPTKQNLQTRNRDLANLITEELESYTQELRSILESAEIEERARSNKYLREPSRWEEAIEILDEQTEEKSGEARIKERYRRRNQKVVEQVLKTVLEQSEYADEDIFSGEPQLAYHSESEQLIIDYPIPAPEDIPKRKEVKYIESRDAFKPKELSDRNFQKLYKSVLYQIALRSVYEIFVGDETEVVRSVVFNGWFTSVNPATGHEETNCVLTLQASREEILNLNFSRVDPEACFEHLGGKCAPILDEESAVVPIAQTNENSGGLAKGQDVGEELGEGKNIAAMDWEDFEYLIGELFERELAAEGGEVNVTQASRDGGIDAIARVPDPLWGGKIVIQAKRYTQTVGVSAARGLYGTLMSEGASRGILVTTSDFSPSTYEFVQDKPIRLVDGDDLLSLLGRHGYDARIDMEEARRQLEK